MNLFPRIGSPHAWLAGVALALLGFIVQSAQAAQPRPLAPAAGITVNTTTDELNTDGDCSLREAIRAANTDLPTDNCSAGSGPDTITLPAGTYTLTLAGAGDDNNLTGDLDITATLTLQGAGLATTTINANALDRALHVPEAGVTLAIFNLTVRNGRVVGAGNFGGGLLAVGPVVLSNTAFVSNTTSPYPDFGGGGGAYFGDAATVTGTTFISNTAQDSPGGGAWFQGPALVQGTTFRGNAATHGGGAWFNATSAVTGTQFLSNTVSSLGGGAWFSGTVKVLGGTFSGNSAGSHAGAHFDGPATVEGATFAGNMTGVAGQGGGAYFQASAVVSGATFISNTAGSSGGGAHFHSLAVITSTSFLNNTAPGIDGGGGAFFGAASTVSGSNFLRNVSGRAGGGAYFSGWALVTGTTFGQNTGQTGAGFYLLTQAMTVTNSTVHGNIGAGIFNDSGLLATYNTTISRNTGVGLYNSGTSTLRNTLLVANNVGGGGPDCSGTLGSGGYNLIGSTASCSFSATTGDVVNIDPRVWGALVGTPGTQPLLVGSPAINAGHPGGCRDHAGNLLPTDQRGVARVGRCDIGAYEFAPNSAEIAAVFLPAAHRPKPRSGINGTVTLSGAPVAGISLDLRYFNGSSFSTLATTTTDASGDYFFNGIPSLLPGQTYYVRFLNTTVPSQLFTWHTPALLAYAAGSSVAAGNFDIANIALVAPDGGATVPLPQTFQWTPRPATPTDNYEFNLFDYADNNPYFFTDPPLGYVSGYTLTGLPPGFSTGVPYVWTMWTYGPEGGYGISYWAYVVTFSTSGSGLTLSELPTPAGQWLDQASDLWPPPNLEAGGVDHP